MSIDIEKAIKWFYDHKGKVTYSMVNRNGASSYDCSSSVYYALRSAGATDNGWAVNTEYEHEWLKKNGFRLVSENKPFTAKRGDVFIWGKRGSSLGDGGHTGIFINGDDIIHCTSSVNGITISDHDECWAWCGKMYYYCYRYEGTNLNKSIDELAREVIAGKYGSGDDRKNALGAKYKAVQDRVNEILNVPPADVSKVVFSYKGANITERTLNTIITLCRKYKILVSYALTVLHYEGLWGNSNVAKLDNNWGGITYSGEDTRLSGIRVTRGSKRPSNEGGHYVHFASVDDFLKDWFYLLRPNGIYKVAGAKTFDEAIKGMFKVGGAKYDYAAAGFDSYFRGTKARLEDIERINGSLKKYDDMIFESGKANDKQIIIAYINDGDLPNAQALLNALKRGMLTKSSDVTEIKNRLGAYVIQVGGKDIKGADKKVFGYDRLATLDEVTKFVKEFK